MNDIEIQGDISETKDEDSNPKKDAILYIENTKDNDLIEFITKAQQQGFNCLDLSKRNIKEFPSQLLEFTSLQYLYLEGNKLIQLSNDLFLRLPHLKWLDLRNNQLTSIPSYGLAKHRSLQYLLLSGNNLRTLPFELGKVKTLSALNLEGNPLDYPPVEIIKQGIKVIQQYLRDELKSDHEFLSSSSSSSDDQQQTPRYSHHHPSIFPRKSKSEFSYYETTQSNFLPPHLQPCIQYKRISYSAIRTTPLVKSRPQSEMKFPQVKTNLSMKKTHDTERNVYISQEQSLMHFKHRDIKIDQQTQELRQKTFITSDDYEGPIIRTPFHSDSHYIQMTNKDQQNGIRYDSQRNHLTDEDEKKRIHDRQIQDRIRQITDKILKRRFGVRSSTYEEKRQARIELNELRRLEFDARKKQIDHRVKSSKKF